jgi:hypothetical protein
VGKKLRAIPMDSAPKPRLTIDSKKFKGSRLEVGKTTQVLVEGKIIREALDDYEAPGRKSFQLEVSKISAPKSERRRFGR